MRFGKKSPISRSRSGLYVACDPLTIGALTPDRRESAYRFTIRREKKIVPVYENQEGDGFRANDQEQDMNTHVFSRSVLPASLSFAAAAAIAVLFAASPARAQFAPPQVMAPPAPFPTTPPTQMPTLQPLTPRSVPSAPVPAQAQPAAPAAAIPARAAPAASSSQ